jgi:hypothetical protein
MSCAQGSNVRVSALMDVLPSWGGEVTICSVMEVRKGVPYVFYCECTILSIPVIQSVSQMYCCTHCTSALKYNPASTNPKKPTLSLRSYLLFYHPLHSRVVNIVGYTATKIPFMYCISSKGTAYPQSQFPHSCVCEQFIYSQDRSTYFPATEYSRRTDCGNTYSM